MAEWILFLCITLGLLYISRRALRLPRSHGFYRFFVWECIAGLIALNHSQWFLHPFAWHQLISWALLVISAFLVIEGVRLLRLLGKADAGRDSAPNYTFEKTTHLVTRGVYQYIRHPLYSSLLCLAWGVLFKRISLPGLLLALAATAFLVATARIEESENLVTFGEEYRIYSQHSKMFIPYLF